MPTIPDTKLPNVSFVIPTLNAEEYLEGCLKSIREQDYPQEKIEIVMADAFSKDRTREIGKKYQAKILDNPGIQHEFGKTIASEAAKGELLFYVDSDNVLASKQWLRLMTRPYIEHPDIVALQPQTVPPPDSSALNRYLGYLFTDPFTWFVYGNMTNPVDYSKILKPLDETSQYKIYRFNVVDHPLMALAQGVGVSRSYQKSGIGNADDILAAIQIIQQGGKIAWVPKADFYHYHVDDLRKLALKYRWRVRNNLTQKVKGMGIVNRLQFFSRRRRMMMILFAPYSLSIIFPFIDAVRQSIKWKDPVMFMHVPASFCIGYVIVTEYILNFLGLNKKLGFYGKRDTATIDSPPKN